jgi:hypothetical protein
MASEQLAAQSIKQWIKRQKLSLRRLNALYYSGHVDLIIELSRKQ